MFFTLGYISHIPVEAFDSPVMHLSIQLYYFKYFSNHSILLRITASCILGSFGLCG